MLLLEHHGLTDPGKVRKNNEDSLLVGEGRDETLFVVADGIGGFEAGEVASSIAVDVLKDVEFSESLEDAIREANRRILAAARGDERFHGMGTTVVAMRFGGTGEEPVAQISHVGDSRAYLLRGGELKPVTEDHSLVAELVRSGDLTRAQASEHPQKNLITRALGAEEEVEVDTVVLPVEPGDRLLLCSDGLSDMVPETGMSKILTSHPEDPERAARALVGAALEAGGADNVTVVVVDVREEDPPAEEVHRGDTQELRAISPEEVRALSPESPRDRGPRGKKKHMPPRPKRKPGQLERTIVALVRAVAVVLVLAALLTPFYLWGSSRYFLGFDEGEVVVYRGLPYAPLGLKLNEEVRRTGLEEADVEERFRNDVESHRLYSDEEQAEAVVRDLEAG
ncbi:MAG: Protein serine/threonine phosphatase PrpC, regulation of stationary phase [uncultured Rubrobacteraceae bacterium]|uniref:Protein serine/threonine phosphatase PrpC, regulation of stationary phase n=1 Tax=uncultured Rubrobacteraceae bacterium TaxID=349277 RepID=A0A6J4P8I2_9ACTN|nr:MAG: Protein serine/threonine phosphatase PrpC, regulation of stationary phase [uncultured Rubrobacteraceae bacterium]